MDPRHNASPPIKITKAVFPVAGLGTRFLPATKATPKEMLVVVDKPLIQYAVEEAYDAGIREMIFVTGRNKRAIEDHFDVAYELESELQIQNKYALIELVNKIKPSDMICVFVRQSKSLGLGHAVLCSETLVRGEPFALILADDLMLGKPSVMKQMIDVYNQNQCSVVAVQKIPEIHTNLYGIIQGAHISSSLIQLSGLIEKPDPSVAPSNLAIAGRYILKPIIFDFIKSLPKGVGNEIQLTDAIAAMLSYEAVLGYKYNGIRYDCGTKLGLLQANIDFGLMDHEFGKELYLWLSKKVESQAKFELV
jgi:UTP--glucose-1-phosphate uridylyltransferase